MSSLQDLFTQQRGIPGFFMGWSHGLKILYRIIKKKIHLLLFSSRFLKHFDILVVPQYGENNIFIL